MDEVVRSLSELAHFSNTWRSLYDRSRGRKTRGYYTLCIPYVSTLRRCLSSLPRAMKQGYHCVLVNDSCVATVSNVALFSDPEKRASDAGSIERFPSRDRIMRIPGSSLLAFSTTKRTNRPTYRAKFAANDNKRTTTSRMLRLRENDSADTEYRVIFEKNLFSRTEKRVPSRSRYILESLKSGRKRSRLVTAKQQLPLPTGINHHGLQLYLRDTRIIRI